MTEQVVDALVRIAPVMLFLVAITVVAEIAGQAGVFDVAARWAAGAGGGRVWQLWLLIVALACVTTVVLGLDTTAVLLTPVVLTLARQIGVPPMPFAVTTVWLANTASLLLPVSNLTNLLAEHRFSEMNLGPHAYLAHSWAPALACVAATVLVIAVMFRSDLSGRYRRSPDHQERDRPLLIVAAAVCLLLVPAFVSGLEPAVPATVAALVLLVALAWREPARLKAVQVPWTMVLVTSVVLTAVIVAAQHGLQDLMGELVGDAQPWRSAAVGVLAANLINNLPAYLSVEPAAASGPDSLMGLLVGVNAGPIITLWGSLATLLWLDRCRRAGVEVRIVTFMARSAVVATAAVGAGVLAVMFV